MKKLLVVLFAVAIATSMSFAQAADDKKMDDKMEKKEMKEMKHKRHHHHKMKKEKMEKMEKKDDMKK